MFHKRKCKETQSKNCFRTKSIWALPFFSGHWDLDSASIFEDPSDELSESPETLCHKYTQKSLNRLYSLLYLLFRIPDPHHRWANIRLKKKNGTNKLGFTGKLYVFAWYMFPLGERSFMFYCCSFLNFFSSWRKLFKWNKIMLVMP